MDKNEMIAEQSKLQAMLMVKTSIEHNSSINTLLIQVINAGNNDSSAKPEKIIESIKLINKEYMNRIEELSNAIKTPLEDQSSKET